MTYEKLKNERYSGKILSKYDENIISALNKFLKINSLTEQSRVGSEFSENYEKARTVFLEQYSNSKTKSSKKNHLHSWYIFYQKNTLNKDLNVAAHTFQSFTMERLAQQEMTLRRLCNLVGTSTPYNWIKYGYSPSKSSKITLEAIDAILDLPIGFLHNNFYKKPEIPDMGVTEPITRHQQKMKRINKNSGKKYTLTKNQFNDQLGGDLRSAIELFYKFKTSIIKPRGKTRPENERWSIDPNSKESGSINIFEGLMKSFFGFLTNKCKIPTEDLSVQHLIDHNLILDYIEFYVERHNCKTRTIHNFLVNLRVFMKFLIEYPELVHPNLSEEEAKSKIKNYNEILASEIKDNTPTAMARDPEEQIKCILNLEDPLAPLIKMSEHLKSLYRYYEKRKSYRSTSLDELSRNIVIVDFLIEKPVRVKNLNFCKIGKNIRKNAKGRYEIHYHPDETKNKKEITKEFSEELSRWIDLYLSKHRDRIHKAPSDNLFISRTTGIYTTTSLAKVFGRLCKKYIGVELRPHAIRHIRATAYLLKHPKDYVYVAELLNDTLKTVYKNYCHIEGRVRTDQDDNDIDELRRLHKSKK